MILKLRTLIGIFTLHRPTFPPSRLRLSIALSKIAPSNNSLIVLPCTSTRYVCHFVPVLKFRPAISDLWRSETLSFHVHIFAEGPQPVRMPAKYPPCSGDRTSTPKPSS